MHHIWTHWRHHAVTLRHIKMRPTNLLSEYTNREITTTWYYVNSRRHVDSDCKFLNYSTSHTLIHAMNRISSAIDQRETTVGVFLDLSKAFDTLDHQILFTKLEHYDIRGVALQWIKSYFSCRRQFVQINQTCSSTQTIKCGVPQGSLLGPLFFILYINDLPKVSKLTEPLLSADDTNIFFSHSNPNFLENVLNNIDVWLRCNNLSTNVQKTNNVTFRPSQRKIKNSFSLSFGGQPIRQSNVTKFLGVYLDEHLTWKKKNMLYYTLIYPYITYCNSAEFIICKSRLCELLQIQIIERILLLYFPNWKF